MGDEIVVKGMRRTPPQAARIDENDDLLAVPLRPVANLRQAFEVVVQLPRHAVRVKAVGEVIELVRGREVHVHGSPEPQTRMPFPDAGGDKRRSRRHRIGLHLLDRLQHLALQVLADALRAIAVRIEKQVQLHARPPQHGQVFAQDRLSLIRRIAAGGRGGAPGAGRIAPGEIHLGHMLPIVGHNLGKPFPSLVRILVSN